MVQPRMALPMARRSSSTETVRLPSRSHARHVSIACRPSAMFTLRSSSAMVMLPLASQSPTQTGSGPLGVGCTMTVGVYEGVGLHITVGVLAGSPHGNGVAVATLEVGVGAAAD